MTRLPIVLLACVGWGCGDDDDDVAADGDADADADADVDGDADADADADGDADGDTDADADADGDCASLRGADLFLEPFEDTDFGSRGWYDSSGGALTTDAFEGASAFECRFDEGTSVCAGGGPGRHLFDGQQAVYLSYRVRYSEGWQGSGRPYHPHEFHFLTSEDDQWVGPAFTHLTTYTEQVGGVARMAIQDSRNVDLDCILLNNDTFVGCGGDFASYGFTEQRSIASCNGLAGDVDGRDCFPLGDGNYYSARFWDSPGRVFTDEAGPGYESDWHHVEAYFRLSTIAGGIGQVDGALRYCIDGRVEISSNAVPLRTGQHPNMLFNQFLVAPYIGDGSPIDQTMWVDDLIVAEGL